MAKLIDILARELKVWPKNCVFITQDSDGDLNFSSCESEPRLIDGDVWQNGSMRIEHGFIGWQIADDFGASIVTRAEWQAARDALVASYHEQPEFPLLGDVIRIDATGQAIWDVAEQFIGVDVTVVAKFRTGDTDMIAVEREDIGQCICFKASMARTKEQIEADELAAKVDEMLSLDTYPNGDAAGGLMSRRAFCEALIADGYRKQEQSKVKVAELSGDGYKIMLGDCLERMKEIPDSSVDLILCDLPYGTTQCAWDVVIPFSLLWEQYLRIAKPEAAIVLCAAQPFSSLLVASNPAHYRYEWIWEKGNATGFLNSKRQPLRAHESAQVFYRRQPVYNPQMTGGHPRRTAKRKTVNSECYGKALALTEYDSTDRYPRSVQFFSSDKQTANHHPTQKPVAWMAFLVSTYTDPGMVVMDNTMGSGTTGVACMNTGRRFIGIEMDENYFGIAAKRISAACSEKLGDTVSVPEVLV